MSIKHLTPIPEEEILANVNKEIINNSQISNFLNTLIFNVPVGILTYLDFFNKDDNFDNNQEISFKPFEQFIETKRHSYSINVKRDQIEDLKKWNIDAIEFCKIAGIQELTRALTREFISKINELADKNKDPYNLLDKIQNFIYKLFYKQYVKTIKIKDVKELQDKILGESNKIFQESKRGSGNFMICGPKVGAMFEHNAQYFTIMQGVSNMNYLHGINLIGKIANIQIYVNTMMEFNDNTIIIGRKINVAEPGLCFVFNEKGTSIEIENIEDPMKNIIKQCNIPISITNDYKINIITKYNIVSVGKNPEVNYRKFVYKSKNF